MRPRARLEKTASQRDCANSRLAKHENLPRALVDNSAAVEEVKWGESVQVIAAASEVAVVTAVEWKAWCAQTVLALLESLVPTIEIERYIWV